MHNAISTTEHRAFVPQPEGEFVELDEIDQAIRWLKMARAAFDQGSTSTGDSYVDEVLNTLRPIPLRRAS
ncbi:hypothetical protein [Variovorax sp. 160MFSha2.1]|uniref:hypothetical protein n=1 Tax=Variovorax sp. 160MFSha2.1 TaxID=3158367 RepID=UPI003AAB17AC